MSMKAVITGTGHYIPPVVKTNQDFTNQYFFGEDNVRIETPPQEVVDKFAQITGIVERRYGNADTLSSNMGAEAARKAIEASGCDPESIDQIILAHNFGNVVKHTIQTDAMPALASRVKHLLGIKNPYCIPYDILFGCPGWVQGLIQADAYIKAGVAKICLVIGTEMLSRVLDMYDRDSMIFADGAGAAIVEAREQTESGVMATASMAHCGEELDYLFMGKSYFPESDPRIRYIKMKGRKVYEYAMKYVPMAMKECLDKAGVSITDVKKVFLHQANEKMDEGIIKSLYKLYGEKAPENIMPMNIHKLGNSSVATVPTLLDTVIRGEMPQHQLHNGDVILFASVGAGMNINAVCYRM